MPEANNLIVVAMGISTHQEPVVYMHKDCHICRSEGFSTNARVLLESNTAELVATLNIVENSLLMHGYIGLSNIALHQLGVSAGQVVTVKHAPVLTSMSLVRKKIHGQRLTEQELDLVM